MAEFPNGEVPATPRERQTLLTRIDDLRQKAEARAAAAGVGASIGVLAPVILPPALTLFKGDTVSLVSVGVSIAASTVGGFLLARERMQEANTINKEADQTELTYYESIREVSQWKERVQRRIEELKAKATKNLAKTGVMLTLATGFTALFAKEMGTLGGHAPGTLLGASQMLTVVNTMMFGFSASLDMLAASMFLAKRKSESALARMLENKIKEG